MKNCISMSNLSIDFYNNNNDNDNCCSLGIKPYYCNDLCNKCGIYNCCCNCPISPTGPMPPGPPMPPIPPMPPGPGPFMGAAQFESTVTAFINNGFVYRFNTINIQGNAIQHIDGTSDIILAPNTLYEFAWENSAQVTADVASGAVLLLNNVPVPGSENTVAGAAFTDVTARANGRFMTGNAESILNLVYVVNPVFESIDQGATLMLATV